MKPSKLKFCTKPHEDPKCACKACIIFAACASDPLSVCGCGNCEKMEQARLTKDFPEWQFDAANA